MACHSYTPYNNLPSPGEETRVRLTELGAATLAPLLGPGIIAIRGRIVELKDSTLTMSVVGVTNRQELEDPWLGERVIVQRSYVSSFERRDLNMRTSVLLAAGVVLGSVVLIAGIKLGGDLAGGRNPGGGTPR